MFAELSLHFATLSSRTCGRKTKLVEMEDKMMAMEEEKAKAESQEGAEGAPGKFSEMSPKELEDLTNKTREELDVAKGKRDFVKCMELQVCSRHHMCVCWYGASGLKAHVSLLKSHMTYVYT